MTFDELDARMRPYETAHDNYALPGVYLVARLDGRRFTRLTKEVHGFGPPFDPRFRHSRLGLIPSDFVHRSTQLTELNSPQGCEPGRDQHFDADTPVGQWRNAVIVGALLHHRNGFCG